MTITINEYKDLLKKVNDYYCDGADPNEITDLILDILNIDLERF